MTTSTSTMPGRGARLAAFSSPAPARPRPTAIPVEEFTARHRDRWLRDAEATLTTLDWRAYAGGRTLHVLDARAIGARGAGYLGFTASAQLHELAAELLPVRRSTTPAAAVAVNIDNVVAGLCTTTITEATEHVTACMIRARVAVVAAHELAHVVDAQATGKRLPATASLQQILDSLCDGRAFAASHQTRVHGAEWLRAYAHLVTRAGRIPHHEQWVAAFDRDVRAMLPHATSEYLDALHPELARFKVDDQLVDVLRTPAPAGFMALFDGRGAAQPATEEK